MELVKTQDEKSKEIKNLLYRKNILENLIERNAKTITLYGEYVEELKKSIKDEKTSELDRLKMQIELDKHQWELRNFISQYKSNQREYAHAVKVELDRVTNGNGVDGVQFKNLEKEAENLAHIELYGKTVKMGDKTELVEIIKSEKDFIKILEKFVKTAKTESKKLKAYEKAKLEKEIFETEIHIQTLQKRLSNRVDYYENQFLPMFERELAEANEKLELYINRANLIIKEGLDVSLPLLLKERSRHQETDETKWLFYTALKNRIHSFISEIKSQKGINLKKYQHIIKPI